MTRSLILAAALSLLALTACGPMNDPAASAGLPPDAIQLSSGSSTGAKGATGAPQLSTAAPVAGGTVAVTVFASQGVNVQIGFQASVFAGPRVVKIPAGRSSATVTLYVNPYLAVPVTSAITARTGAPNASTFFSTSVTAVPSATPPAGPAPQVASFTFSSPVVVTGTTVTGTLLLTRPAPASGLAVQVAISTDFFMLDADVPPVVVVPAGASSATFPIHTHLSNPVYTTLDEAIIANAFGGTFMGGPLTINAR